MRKLQRRAVYSPDSASRKALRNVPPPDVVQMIHLYYASTHAESCDTTKLWSL
jgi:hypothetical protein